MPDASGEAPILKIQPENEWPCAMLALGEGKDNLEDDPKVRLAYWLARLLHHDQEYDDKQHIPYIEHVAAVANLVYKESVVHGQAGEREKLVDEICAALLHDSVEDQPDVVSAPMIGAIFGERVGAIVGFCTDRWEPKYCLEAKPEYPKEDTRATYYPTPPHVLEGKTPDEVMESLKSRKAWVEAKEQEENKNKKKDQESYRKKDGIVGPDWLERKRGYLSKLQTAVTHPRWEGRRAELESALTICCADKLMNMTRSNQRLEAAITHYTSPEKWKKEPETVEEYWETLEKQKEQGRPETVHEFWGSFKSAQMARAQYDCLLANAFEQVRHNLGQAAEGRFSSLADRLSKEVGILHGMMVDLKGTKEKYPRFQRHIMNDRAASAGDASVRR